MIPYPVSEETNAIIHSTVELTKAAKHSRVIEIFTVELTKDFENLEVIESDRIIILHELTSACFNANRFEETEKYAHHLIKFGKERKLHFWIARGYEFLGKLARQRTQYLEVISYINEAMFLYKQHFPQESVIPLHVELGIAYRSIGEYTKAIEHYFIAIEFYSNQNNIIEVSKLYGNIGNVFWKMQEYENAIEYHKKSLECNNQLNNQDGIATCYGNIGLIYNSQGNYYESLEYLLKSLQIFEEEAIEDGVLFALMNLASIYFILDENETSEKMYQKAYIVAKKLNLKHYEAIILENLGGLKIKTKNFDEAKNLVFESLKLFENIGSKEGIAKCYKYLSEVFKSEYDVVKAKDYINKALDIFEELQSKLEVAQVKVLLVDLYLEQGSFDEKVHIENLLFEAEDIYLNLQSKFHLKSVYDKLAKYYHSIQSWEKAFSYLVLHNKFEKEVSNEKVKNLAESVQYKQTIAEESAKSNAIDGILKNILPHSIAERLKNKENNIVKKHNNISVFFSDIVGFTTFSQTVTPEVLLKILNLVFTEMDSLAKEYTIEKIKTIGDAYMAVCGAPEECEHHSLNIARFAVAVRDFMIKYRKISEQDIHIRIGLHCGEAIAGVIGTQKFAYDLWGDTINTASRMESHGESGKIHISETFAQQLKDSDEFVITYRGEMNVKGKGILRTYWLDNK